MLSDRSAFAGSIALPDSLVRVMIHEVGVSLPEAVKMLTAVPAEILGVNKGLLAPGRDADVITFDEDIVIRDAFVAGMEVI